MCDLGFGIDDLRRRMEAVESMIAAMADEVRTHRVVVGDDVARLVTETVHGVLELRLELTSPNGATLLLFANPGDEDLPPGVGAQVHVAGNSVEFWEHWLDRWHE